MGKYEVIEEALSILGIMDHNILIDDEEEFLFIKDFDDNTEYMVSTSGSGVIITGEYRENDADFGVIFD
jgi:hypothetical protein